MQPDWPAQFVQWLSDWDIGHQEVVIEAVESEKVDPALGWHSAVMTCAARGCVLRWTIWGQGLTACRCWVWCALIIRLDRGLVHEARGSRVRSVLLQALVSMAERLGATVMAEGLERAEDVAFCRSLGIHSVQGYLLA